MSMRKIKLRNTNHLQKKKERLKKDWSIIFKTISLFGLRSYRGYMPINVKDKITQDQRVMEDKMVKTKLAFNPMPPGKYSVHYSIVLWNFFIDGSTSV